MGHQRRPRQAWDVCKQLGGEAASGALTQAPRVVQAKREKQGRHCHLAPRSGGAATWQGEGGAWSPHTSRDCCSRLIFGMLYPAYASYKAVKSKNIREYVRWMMYWIVFAIFMAAETFTDIFISWFPFYYEFKMAFVLWLLSPYTKGASLLYRKFVHPSLSRHEKEIDACIVQAKERSYETMLSFGKRSLNIAASAAVQAATKSQGALAGRLRSFSMQDLRSIPDTPVPTYQDPLYLEDQVPRRRPPIGYRPGGLQDSDTEDECWSDNEIVPQPPVRPREKPLGRSQSLRVVKRKPLTREGTSRSLKVRTRKKAMPSDMDS
uniref:Receptor expression-enhancing protein n=1 Tax=Mus spicilegus TaxID=10103 RepID=A0A8C6IKW7_MUSSI